MDIRRWHRIMGACLVLPFLAWASTGIVFFIKPGYGDAYASLKIKTYPMEPVTITPDPQWRSMRVMRTILGDHLLADTADGPAHLDANTGELWEKPDDQIVRTLIDDAVQADPERYGAIQSVEEGVAHTDTGVRITLNWNQLSLYQYGEDTQTIDWLYRVHYLQWTGQKSLDRVLGMLGLALLILMTFSGVKLLIKP